MENDQLRIDKMTATKILAALERIADATELLAMQAHPQFFPKAEWLMKLKREDNLRRSQPQE